MKLNYKVIATGPWVGELRRELIIPADSAAEACEIARSMYGATSAVSMGPQSPYLGPGSTSGGKIIDTSGNVFGNENAQ